VLYNSNKGSEVAGAHGPVAPGRAAVLGSESAVRCSCHADPDAGVVIKVVMSMRVTDNGDFEVSAQRILRR
jgi:hypothetical protein